MKFESRDYAIINWSEYPMLRLTICIIIGIVVGDKYSIPPQWALTICFSFVLAYIYLGQRDLPSLGRIRAMSLIMIIMGISLGYTRVAIEHPKYQPHHFLKYSWDSDHIMGCIASDLKYGKRQSAVVEVRQINGNGCKGKLLVYFDTSDSLLTYRKGDVISFHGKIGAIKENKNPLTFNFKEFLRFKGVVAQIFLRNDGHEFLYHESPFFIYRIANDIRDWALTLFQNKIKDKDQLAVASAMVLGYREHISKDLYTSFSETGAMHVLAVSGIACWNNMHVFLIPFQQI